MADICPFVGYLGGEWVKAVDIGELAVLLGVEIVVLVGDRSLSIDGVLYTSKPELPFQKVLEYFRDKYAYYCQNQ